MNTVKITIEVPVAELDFSDCPVYEEKEPSEFWGSALTVKSYEVDLADATWNGYQVELSDYYHDVAAEYLVAERNGVDAV